MTGDSPSAAHLQAIPDLFVRELASLGRLRSYPKNTVFITEGDSSDSVFVILAGRGEGFLSGTPGAELSLPPPGPRAYCRKQAPAHRPPPAPRTLPLPPPCPPSC